MAEAITTTEAVAHFFNSLEPEEAQDERRQVDHFLSWIGPDREMTSLTATDIAAYVASEQERVGSSAHLEPVRGFLAYCSRLAFTSENLVPYLGLGGGGARGDAAVEELGGKAYYVTLDGLAAL